MTDPRYETYLEYIASDEPKGPLPIWFAAWDAALEKASVIKSLCQVRGEYSWMWKDRDRIAVERDQLAAEKAALERERDELKAELERLRQTPAMAIKWPTYTKPAEPTFLPVHGPATGGANTERKQSETEAPR